MTTRIWPSEDNESDKKKLIQTGSLLKSGLSKKRPAEVLDKENKSKEEVSASAKKNRPEERPTNIRVSRLNPKEISGITLPKKGLDPRFDGKGSQDEQHLFSTAYKFIDDIRQNEIQDLQEKIKKTKNQDEIETMEAKILQLRQKIQKNETEREKTKLFSEYKRQEKELVAQGKTPYYLKKSSIKNLGAASKFLELEQTGKIDKFISKRRTKGSTKDRKYMPSEY